MSLGHGCEAAVTARIRCELCLGSVVSCCIEGDFF